MYFFTHTHTHTKPIPISIPTSIPTPIPTLNLPSIYPASWVIRSPISPSSLSLILCCKNCTVPEQLY
jgi:hypothetical protein